MCLSGAPRLRRSIENNPPPFMDGGAHGDPREAACRGRCSHHREMPNETIAAAIYETVCQWRGSGAPTPEAAAVQPG